MKQATDNNYKRVLDRYTITRKEAISIARELLELAEGNGVNEQGRETTHWVVDKEGRLVDKSRGGVEWMMCFAVKR